MGGTLATALACRRPSDCAGLALLATPWDFQAEGSAPGPSTIARHVLAHGAGMVGSASIDLLQSLFAMIDPMTVPNKFAAFADLDPAADAALRFVAIEDWLNDGVPLGADIAARCLIEWYGHNAPALGQWRVFGRKVQPEALTIPAVLAIPAHDRIVPAASALALAAALPGAEIIRPKSGHIGMVAGRRARDQLWQPLLAWLLKIAALQKK
jgi:polyhydroxyalkanoate synthase